MCTTWGSDPIAVCLSILLTHSQTSWLTAFIFAAQDYNEHSCYFNAPPGVTCGRKKANEAFIFLALYVFPFYLFFLFYPGDMLHILPPPPQYLSSISSSTSSPLITNPLCHSIFTFFGMFLEVAGLWAYRKENAATAAPAHEKNEPGARPPLDAPVEQNVPAGTV